MEVDVSSVYGHSAICETYLVYCYSIHLLSISVGGDVSSVYVYSVVCDTYLVLQYSLDILPIGVGGRCILSICAFCYMWNVFGVVVLHRSIFNQRGVDVCSEYVHSTICEGFLV